MKVSELMAKQGNVDIELDVVEISEPREFSKFGKTGKVASATAKDESGEVKLSLWNEQVDQIKAGYRVAIKNGYVNEWQGEKQLSTGRFGTLEVLKPSAEKLVEEAAEPAAAPEEPAKEEAPADNGEISEEDVK
tara:strand:+ start:92 stop:493 length:402 start_codon:yes stop_codon:yes gene_type:complete